MSGPDWYEGVADRILDAVAPDGDVLVVAHSGAGGFVPVLADRLGERLAGVLLVDATTPYPGRCWFDSASPALGTRVRNLAASGVLPPWNRWWAPGAMARLLPDEAQREAFAAELPRVPLAYFEATAPGSMAWEAAPGGYLQLSEACADDAVVAERRGWIVRREALHHLAMLTDPDRVASMITEMSLRMART